MSSDLYTQDNVAPGPIGDNECGIVLHADGEFQIFNTFKDIDPTALSPLQLEMMNKLVGLSIALKFPQVMQMLIDMSNDPDMVKQGASFIDKGRAH